MTDTAGRLTKDAVDTYYRFCAYIDATHAAHIAGPFGTERARAAHIAESAKATIKQRLADFCAEIDNAGTEDAAKRAHIRFCTDIDAARSAYIRSRIVEFFVEKRGYDKSKAEKVFRNVPKDVVGTNPAAHDAGKAAARAAGEDAWDAACFTRFGGAAYDAAYIAEFCERAVEAADKIAVEAAAETAAKAAEVASRAAANRAAARAKERMTPEEAALDAIRRESGGKTPWRVDRLERW